MRKAILFSITVLFFSGFASAQDPLLFKDLKIEQVSFVVDDASLARADGELGNPIQNGKSIDAGDLDMGSTYCFEAENVMFKPQQEFQLASMSETTEHGSQNIDFTFKVTETGNPAAMLSITCSKPAGANFSVAEVQQALIGIYSIQVK